MPAASCSGLSATTICIVEQFGLATIPRCAVERLGVDLGDDERDVVVHPPPRGVVDDDRARGGEARRPLAGGRAAGGEDARRRSPAIVSSAQRLHDAAALELAAGRALGGERHDLARREAALAQQRRSITPPTWPVAPTTATR